MEKENFKIGDPIWAKWGNKIPHKAIIRRKAQCIGRDAFWVHFEGVGDITEYLIKIQDMKKRIPSYIKKWKKRYADIHL